MTTERGEENTQSPHAEKLMRNIAKWIEINDSSEPFKEFKRQQIGWTLSDEWERRLAIVTQPATQFTFPSEVEKEHDLIMAFLHLQQAQFMLSQCEYYFRRFPFGNLPVTRDDHARNMCEFYFSCFYIFKSRLKETLNNLKAACPYTKIDVGKTLHAFNRSFDRELRTRNRVHHHEPFDDIELHRIVLPRLLALGKGNLSKSWNNQHRSAYRKFSRVGSPRAGSGTRNAKHCRCSCSCDIERGIVFKFCIAGCGDHCGYANRAATGIPMPRDRLTAFSDGVVAIIITIMVLELKVPQGAGWEALGAQWPVFLSYVLSFVYVAIYWNNHHHLLHTVSRVRGIILWANMHLLFWLSLVPFATGWMGENSFARLPTALYGVSLLMPAIAWYLLQLAITRTQGARSPLAKALGRDVKGKISPLLYVAAIALAFASSWISLAIYVLVALMWVVPDRRIEHALALEG